MSKYKEKMDLFEAYEVLKSKRPLLEDIKQFENQISYSLPDDYIDFLLDYAGFALAYTFASFYRPEELDQVYVEVFYGFLPGDSYDLIYTYDVYKDRMPNDLIPIARDSGGGEICLSVNGDNKGAVYYWDRYFEEELEEGEEAGYSNLFLIARNFEDFINSLEKDDEDSEEDD